jgi:glycosyltransferase involved in cell wall biosynthesis
MIELLHMVSKKIDLSIIITVHRENILAHRTMLSIRRAIKALDRKYTSEIIMHVDNPDDATNDYIRVNKNGILKNVKIFTNHFGDPGSSRNFAIQKAAGQYIATIDADDLMSKNWLVNSLDAIKLYPNEQVVAHPEYVVLFGNKTDLIVEKYRPIDTDNDTLMSVYSSPWPSTIIASRDLLIKYPYPTNAPGYGFEDWWLSNTFIHAGVRQLLIPETVFFVRKRHGSESQQKTDVTSVVKFSELLSLSNIRSLKPVTQDALKSNFVGSKGLKSSAKRIAKRIIPARYHRFASVILYRLRPATKKEPDAQIPKWLADEWSEMNAIDAEVISPSQGKRFIPIYPKRPIEHDQAGALYKAIVDQLQYNDYDYLLFVPWLIAGGAEKYIIDMINTIQKMRPDKHIVVISTLPADNIYKSKLNHKIDFVDLGNLAVNILPVVVNRVLEQLIEHSGVTHIQVMNSKLGYDFIDSHRYYMKSTNKIIIATSFNRIIDKNNRQIGYTVTDTPHVYDIVTVVTSDNRETLRIWEEEYGFDSKKMLLHRQGVEFDPSKIHWHASHDNRLKVLWASRIVPEKLPQLVPEIGALVSDFADIDMFGSCEPKHRDLLPNLPENVTYRGAYQNGLSTLVNSKKYDIYLYTSTGDGTPNALLEAIQLGLPIVAPAVGGIPDFIIDQKSGLLIDDFMNPKAYSDALHKMLDEKLRNKLAKGAIQIIAQDFSPEKYQKNIAEYLDIISY